MKIDNIEILCDADIETALRQKFSRAANDLRLSGKAAKKYEETIQKDIKLVKKGRKSTTIIGARLYITSLLIAEPRSQKKIAQATKASEQGIRNTYHLMTNRKKEGSYAGH